MDISQNRSRTLPGDCLLFWNLSQKDRCGCPFDKLCRTVLPQELNLIKGGRLSDGFQFAGIRAKLSLKSGGA